MSNLVKIVDTHVENCLKLAELFPVQARGELDQLFEMARSKLSMAVLTALEVAFDKLGIQVASVNDYTVYSQFLMTHPDVIKHLETLIPEDDDKDEDDIDAIEFATGLVNKVLEVAGSDYRLSREEAEKIHEQMDKAVQRMVAIATSDK